jgi:threonine dehydrogenase-like Zn-dependent dehydrogenase
MRAISLREPGQVEVVDIPEPLVGPEDVLVEVHYVGLCGSDLAAYQGLSPMVSYPRVPGHEVSGVVLAKGERVPDRVGVGDRVMVSPYSSCGLCPACRIGRTNCCEHNETLGVQRDGVLTSRFAIHYAKVYSSRELSLRELALAEPLSVGYHATNRGRVSEIDTALVLGCGTIGMGAIVAAARKGARVVAVDVDASKLAQAKRFGAAVTIDSRHEDPLAVVRDLTDGEGASVAIEAIGLPQTYRLAVDAVCFAGRVVYIGYAKHEVTFDTKEFVRKELDITGSRNALHVFPSVIRMLEARERPFEDLISRVYPFAETGAAFRDWAASPGKFTKILIDVRPGQAG